MYSMSDLKVGKIITHENAPYQIVKAEHSKQARSAAVLRTKMRNLITGQMLEQTFQSGDTAQEADLENIQVNFLYKDAANFVFMNNETYDQFELSAQAVGDDWRYIKEGEDVVVMFFEGKPVSLALPPKVDLKVTEAPPGVKGDSATNATKKVKLETGYEVGVPLFIKEGNMVRVNTESGEYVERVN